MISTISYKNFKNPVSEILRKGKNILLSSFTLTNAFLPEDIYIIGEFGVDSRSFAIIKEKRKLKAGDWCNQGYPQYNDTICYKFLYAIKKKKNVCYEIEFDKFEGTVANVFIRIL